MSKVLEKYFNPKNILLAFYRVRCTPERLVKDQFGLRAFEKKLDKNCERLSAKILKGDYKPTEGFKYYMPKASKTQRTKTLLMVEDAIFYQAIANVLAQQAYSKLNEHRNFVFGSILVPEVKLDTDLLDQEEPNFFFFKFWKSLYQTFRDSVIQSITVDKVTHKFETDITGFFDSIPHYNLFLTLSQEFGIEDEILDLLGDCLNVWSGTKENKTPGVGIPQGPLPSHLLANLLLYPLDNELIGSAYKYYRYMDDIKIYGYNEKELLAVLINIDNYTKGHGLSINSKKTSIEVIDPNKEDETVKELKKIELFGYYEDAEEQGEEEDETELKPVKKRLEKMMIRLSEQDESGEIPFVRSNISIIDNPQEIEEFWRQSIKEVEMELPALFKMDKDDTLKLADKENTDDIDFIRLSVKYSSALQALDELGFKVEPNEALLPYWLFVFENYFWRANSFGYTLMRYKNNKHLKSALKDFYKANLTLYEWVRYYIVIVLSYSQTFTDRELRQTYFKWLQYEESNLVKLALYRFLAVHSNNEQLRDTLKQELNKEKNQYLKAVVVDFMRSKSMLNENIVEFIKSVGL